MIVTGGATDVSVPFYFVDDVGGANPGEPTTGLLFSDIETGGSASYQRQGAARVDFTLITLANAATAYTAGGFLLVNDTEMPGVYRCDIPDAAIASGADFVLIYLRAASGKNTLTRPLKIDLTAVDLRDAVRGGMSALPAADADAPGGMVISDAGAFDVDALNTQLADIPTVTEFNARTILAAAYFDPANDAVAVVTLVGTTTTNSDMRGTNSAALATALATAQLDLDIITGADGVFLAVANQPTGWPANLAASAGQIIKATVDTVTNTHTPTTTVFQADDITESTTDHFKGRIVIFTSGALAGQATDITAYSSVGGIGQFTCTALSEAPANNNTFIIV